MPLSDQMFHPYLPSRMPDIMDSPYFKATDMEHHYPNLYDYKRAAIFNCPQPMFAPFNRPLFVAKSRPSYLAEEYYRVRSDWLSDWSNALIRHNACNLKDLTPSQTKKSGSVRFCNIDEYIC
ncbi:hypothetical protein Bpfe_021341 [Biomphalaria pfeifferi]|uniref:Uncharacterized protein n=1 Tax=Biomphalaria pfeifferi TaxID=112525 RepID=A0AAD8F3G4_BIOPF|nr:hypothetical protein Bpfe_021341 [Biomphalaria pfeifferi]